MTSAIVHCINVKFTLLCRIFQIPRLGIKLKQDSIPLSYTPRKFITHPTNRYFYLIEGDHRVYGETAAAQKIEDLVSYSARFAL
jgi:splicing factor 3B subunit 3